MTAAGSRAAWRRRIDQWRALLLSSPVLLLMLAALALLTLGGLFAALVLGATAMLATTRHGSARTSRRHNVAPDADRGPQTRRAPQGALHSFGG